MKKIALLFAIFVLAFSTAFAAYVEIGDGTSSTNYVPCYGFYDYSWSSAIYLQSEIGSAIDINQVSFYVNNTVASYEMLNQKIYMKHTADAAYTVADWPNPDSTGFTLVYNGPVTWTGPGWFDIPLDTSFSYNGTDNLIVYWENNDGTYSSGYPKFNYTSQADRVVRKYQDGSFPAVAGTIDDDLANIRLHYPSAGADISLAYSSYDFGYVNEGGMASFDLTITNNGTSDLVVSGATVNAPFYCTYTGTIAPLATDVATVTFEPTAATDTYFTEVLSFTSNATSGSGDITLNGESMPAGYTFIDFEDSTFPPGGWSLENITGNDWSRYSSATHAYDGQYSARLNYYYSGGYNTSESRLITPKVLTSAGDYLSFYTKKYSATSTDTLLIEWSSDLVTWTELTNVALTDAYQQITVDLSNAGGTDAEVYLAFHGKTEAASSRYIYIDAVVLPEMYVGPPEVPANPSPVDGAIDIDVTTVLTWEVDFFTEDVDLYFGTDQTLVTNSDPSVQVITATMATTYDPPGNLDPLTTYYWKVVANNSVPVEASTSSPVWSFTTKPDVTQALPWVEDFETGTMPWYFAGFLGANAQANVNATAANTGSFGMEAYADNSSYSAPSNITNAWTAAQPGGDNAEWTQYFDVILDLTTATNPGLKFWYAMGYQYNDNYNNFWVLVDDGATDTWTELFATQTAGAATPWTQEIIDLASYAGNTVTLRFFHNNKYDDNYLWLDDLNVTEINNNPDPPLAVAPADGAINVGIDTGLEWINGYNTDNIDLYFGTDQTLVTNLDASVQVLAATDTTMYQPAAMLDYTTDYYWCVVENNALDAQTVGPVWSFSTMDDPTRTLPFAEDFETGMVPWYMMSTIGTQNGMVYVDTSAVHGGMYDLVCHTDGTTGWTNPDSLGHAWTLAQPGGAGFTHAIYNDITLDLTTAANPSLNFWYSMGYNFQDYYNNFWVVVDDGTTTTELLATQTAGGLLDWTEFNGSLAAFGGQTVTLRFVQYAKYEENFLKIDDITIDEGPALPTLVINEIHYNPSGAQGDDLDWEFVEIYNVTNAPIDLTGYTLDEDDGSNNSVALTGYTIDANGFLVITAGDTTYSWLTCPVINNNGYFGLSNSGNDLTIRNNGVDVDHVQYDDGAPWPTSPDGGGPSLELIDPMYDNEDPASWQASWVMNGTPGAVNSVEPDPIPYTIYQIQSEVHTGDLTVTSGIVTGVFPNQGLFTIQDGTGAFSGVWVSSADAVAMGDDVTVTGLIAENYDLTQINASEVLINSNGNMVPAPAEITTGAAATEDYEGVLVQVIGNCTNDNLGYGEWEVDDGITDAPVAVDDFNVPVTPVLGDSYKVVGPVNFSFSAFKIEPRMESDVENLSNEITWPPLNLDYVVTNQTDVTLTWEAPHTYGWNAYFENLTHLSWAGDQRATMFDVTEFGFSYPMEITGIKHLFYEHPSYPWGADTTFTFVIYDADGSTVLYQSAAIAAEAYPTPTEVSFPAVTLNNNFYVAIAPTNPVTGYPSSAAEENLVNAHGFTGDPTTGWTASTMEFATMINITAPAVEGLTARHATLRPGKVSATQPVTDVTTSAKILDPIMGYDASDALLGYNVYRDGVQLNADMITDLMYDDLGLTNGTYNYYVTALWDTGESAPSTAVDVTIAVTPTITVDYTLPDSPAQVAYPNNTNPYSNTLTDLGWTTVNVTEDQPIYEWSMTLDWESVDYYSEGSMWVESPGGTETVVNVYNPTALGLVQGLVLTTDAFNGENMMGTWNIWLEDSYGDGGHQVSNVTMHLTYEDQGGPSTLPFYDFEADDGGFTHSGTNDSWEWGIPTDPEGPAAAHSGQKLWATNLAGPFANSAQFELVTPAIDLPANGCMLTFWHWYDMGNAPFDGGNLKITTDAGATWTLITPEGGYPTDPLGSSNPLNPEPGYSGMSAGWEMATFDLLSYGGNTIQIKWEIGTTSVVENPGWYIDDVLFYEEIFGELSGMVTEVNSGTPIDGAVVTIGDWSGTTDATGTYSIPGILVGTYDGVTCEADGYITSVADGVVIAQNQVTPLDFVMDYASITVNPMSFAVSLDQGMTTDEMMNIANSGTGDLVYDASVSFLTDESFSTYDGSVDRSLHAENYDIEEEVDRTSRKVRESATDDMWDLQFSYDVDTPSGLTGLAGAETDGDYFYVTKWASSDIAKFNLDGTYVETFSIAGVSGLRDLAYDGQYFYGGAASTTIFQMDFDSQTLVGQITSPVAVRAIAYDDDNDAFWVNNWSEDLNLVDRNGSTINTIAGPPSMYGCAYDNVTGGPYLWIFSGTTSGGGCQVEQIDVATGALTGVMHSVSGDLGDATIAGGLFSHGDIVSGTYTLGGLGQASPDMLFGYEIGVTESWLTLTNNGTGTVLPGANLDVTLHFDASGLPVGDKTAEIVISSNAGDDVIVPVTLTVSGVATYPLPFAEDFEGGALPADWSQEYLSGTVDWTVDTGGHSGNPAGAHGGTYNALFYAGNYNGDTSVLVTPALDASAFSNVELTFWHAQNAWAGDQDTLAVFYATAPGGAWNYLASYTDDTPDWTERTLTIPETSATLMIGFAATSGYGYGVCIDDVSVVEGTVTTNPPSNLAVTPLGYATWDAPATDNTSLFEAARANTDNTRDLIGYNVYLDGDFVEMVTATSYQYTGLTPATTYTAGVTALYDEGESTMITEDFTYTPVINPPSNLVATVNNYNDVNLTWEQPGGTGGVLAYHTGYDANGIGTGGAVDFSCAARFTADELGDLYGNAINSVRVVIHSADFSGVTVKVWEGGSFGDPGTEVYSADITGDVIVADWTDHALTTPVTLVAGNEYWIGYEINATGDHPAAVDAGPMAPEKGSWMYFNGAWDLLTNLGATLDFNWCIEGIVGPADTAVLAQKKVARTSAPAVLRNASFTTLPLTAAHAGKHNNAANTENTRSLLGYKIYRDGAEIHEITDPSITTWDDMGLDEGSYDYHVTAVYDDGESVASNTENVTITLGAPVNFNAVSQGASGTIMCTWTAPAATRDLTEYKIYRDGVEIGTTTALFYADLNVVTGVYDYHATAVYSDTYESDPSNVVQVDHTSAPTPVVPVVTALDGNYPNPFNPTTDVKFSLSEPGAVRIDVFNIKGEKVRTLVDGEMEAAFHTVTWNGVDDSGRNVGSGVYFYKMRAGKYTSTKKMILMK